jgi:hypothetical protein
MQRLGDVPEVRFTAYSADGDAVLISSPIPAAATWGPQQYVWAGHRIMAVYSRVSLVRFHHGRRDAVEHRVAEVRRITAGVPADSQHQAAVDAADNAACHVYRRRRRLAAVLQPLAELLAAQERLDLTLAHLARMGE